MSEKLKVAVIGLGRISKRHLNAYKTENLAYPLPLERRQGLRHRGNADERDPPYSRQPDLDDLSGAYDLAQPRFHHR